MDPILRNLAGKLEYIEPRKKLTKRQESFAVRPDRNDSGNNGWSSNTRSMKLSMFPHQAALLCFGRKYMHAEDDWTFAFWPDENSLIDIVLRRRRPSGET